MTISEINIYPIKSLKGIALNEAVVEKRGLQFDRRWMLTDPDGMFFTQREVPKMATVEVIVESGELIVENGSLGRMTVPFEPDKGHRQDVIVWKSEVAGLVYNGEVSEWFSDVLSKKCQLVLMPEATERHVNKEFDSGNDIVSFADGYPLLLTGEASLEELNKRIEENFELPPRPRDADTPPKQGGERFVPLPMNRFRPNVVVQGSVAFEEDRWARIRIGEITFRVPKPCGRCVMTTVEQTTGTFDGKEPLRTLATFRMAKQVHPDKYEAFGHTPNSVLFGENLIPENPGGTIAIGDQVSVVEFRK
jgi:uncharacterized protein YcbX